MSVGSQLAGTFEFDGFLINFHGKHDFFMFLIKSERIFDGIHQLDEIDMLSTKVAEPYSPSQRSGPGGKPVFT